MGYKWIKENKIYSYTPKKFQCDFLRDIGKLPTSKRIGEKQEEDTISDNPCAPGSECFCFEDGSIWLLGIETDTWIKVGFKYGSSSGNGGSSSPNITSYNQLNDIPLKNLTGHTSTPLILSNLQPGIYKIAGNYSVIANSKSMSADACGNIFMISNGKIMELSSKGVTLFDLKSDGTYTTESYATVSNISTEILKQLNSDNFNLQIENIVNQNLSYATNVDIDSLF